MDVITILLFIAGLGLLIVGAEVLVRGASRLAAAIGASPLVIGLTVVAYGTSSPELAVSVQAGIAGQPDIALGNVVGSNIFNILFIVGLSALIAPLFVARQLIRLDVPLMIGVAVLFLLLSLDGMISRADGLLLVSGALVYTVFIIRQSRREEGAAAAKAAARTADTPDPSPGQERGARQIALQLLLVVVGLGLLVLGSRWLVDGAVAFAQLLGVSELIIGLTLVAIGTSLPEIATSVVAALRGERDIAVGNVVGSNIFNILFVLGLASVIPPAGVPVAASALNFDIPVMIAVALACLPIFFTGQLIARWEGGLFLAYYVAYTLYLYLAATDHAALEAFSVVMLAFVVPLTALTLVALALRALHIQRRRRALFARVRAERRQRQS